MYPSFFFILLRIRFRNGIKGLTLGAKTLLIITWPLLSIITTQKKQNKTKQNSNTWHTMIDNRGLCSATSIVVTSCFHVSYI